MEGYKLRADEVELFKGNVLFTGSKATTEFMLTNLNLVFVTKTQKLFKEDEIKVDTYPVEDIKMYQGIPQIKTKGNIVKFYLLETEIEVQFVSRMDIGKFMNEANKLLTGETTAIKRAKKVKDTIELVDDTLGIKTVQVTTNVLKNGIVGSLTGNIGKIGAALLNKKKK